MKYRPLKSLLTVIFGGFLLPTSSPGADPAPKLMHRPLPGMPRAAAPTAAASRAVPRTAATTVINAVNPERARIVFIHRRDKLPEAFTKDLAPSKKPSDAQATGAVAPAPARQGRIKIIPKAEVATLMAAETQPSSASEE